MPTTLAWWSVLCAAAAVNVAAWGVSAWLLGRRRASFSAEAYATRRSLLLLSAIYVLGCGFRSLLPMVDVPRICLHDTPVSRIFVGRLVATVAELAFSVQWVLLLKEAGAVFAARAIVPMLVAAEAFSWMAVLTRNNLHHAIENSLWTASAVVAAAGMAALWREVGGQGKRAIVAVAVSTAGYVAFMVSYDVPMYLRRWWAGIPVGKDYLGFEQGMRELLARCIVTHDWARWQEDAVWLTLYFTIAVWISIALVHAPSLRNSGSEPELVPLRKN